MKRLIKGKQGRRMVGVAAGLLSLSLLCFAAGDPAAPNIPWSKPYHPRAWTYTTGTQMTGAYDSYKSGNVTVITESGEQRQIPLNQLIAQDQAWVLEALKKPHGLINDVIFVQWQDQQPLFQINASFFAKGNLTKSPVVYVQYLLRDAQNRVIKRISGPVALYPTSGKYNLDQMETTVLKPCLGQKEEGVGGVTMPAYRAVMLLPQDRKEAGVVLDLFSKQNDSRLKSYGIPLDWWTSRYPVGLWPSPIGVVVKVL